MWWLELDRGLRRGLDGRGLLIGRRADCDIVVDDPRASSIHCLVVLGRDGPELRSLGRNPTLVNDTAETSAQLVHGDVVEVPGLRFRLLDEGIRGSRWTATVRDRRFGVRGRLHLGEEVRIEGWKGGLVLSEVQGGLVVEVLQDVRLNNEVLEPGWVEVVAPGDVLVIGEDRVRIGLADEEETDATVQRTPLPVTVEFDFLPTGAQVRLVFADRSEVSVELPELRARLIAVLLGSPSEFVEDDVLLRKIWPGRSDRGRTDLNTLVHRARKDLLRAGVNPGPLLVRARSGGGACFHVARGATVRL